jgi:hypothetical protein
LLSGIALSRANSAFCSLVSGLEIAFFISSPFMGSCFSRADNAAGLIFIGSGVNDEDRYIAHEADGLPSFFLRL